MGACRIGLGDGLGKWEWVEEKVREVSSIPPSFQACTSLTCLATMPPLPPVALSLPGGRVLEQFSEVLGSEQRCYNYFVNVGSSE